MCKSLSVWRFAAFCLYKQVFHARQPFWFYAPRSILLRHDHKALHIFFCRRPIETTVISCFCVDSPNIFKLKRRKLENYRGIRDMFCGICSDSPRWHSFWMHIHFPWNSKFVVDINVYVCISNRKIWVSGGCRTQSHVLNGRKEILCWNHFTHSFWLQRGTFPTLLMWGANHWQILNNFSIIFLDADTKNRNFYSCGHCPKSAKQVFKTECRIVFWELTYRDSFVDASCGENNV